MMTTIFARGLAAPETPRWMPDGSMMCVELAPARGCVSRISADGTVITLVARTGMPNGCLADKHGVIWVAETYPHPALMCVTPDGAVEVYLDSCDGEPMLLPNDLCFGPNGLLYMTDSGMKIADWAPGLQIRPDWQTAPFDGRVYEIDLRAKSVRILDRGFRFTNGIAWGADGHLYFNEMITGNVYRLLFSGGTFTGRRELYGNVLREDWDDGFRGPDGMAFAINGDLYCTVFGQRDVTVLGTDGKVKTRIETQGARPTNLVFGRGGEKKIYVTELELGQIEVYEVESAGLPLYQA